LKLFVIGLDCSQCAVMNTTITAATVIGRMEHCVWWTSLWRYENNFIWLEMSWD